MDDLSGGGASASATTSVLKCAGVGPSAGTAVAMLDLLVEAGAEVELEEVELDALAFGLSALLVEGALAMGSTLSRSTTTGALQRGVSSTP